MIKIITQLTFLTNYDSTTYLNLINRSSRMYKLLSFTNEMGQFLVRSRVGFSIVFTTIQNVIFLLGWNPGALNLKMMIYKRKKYPFIKFSIANIFAMLSRKISPFWLFGL